MRLYLSVATACLMAALSAKADQAQSDYVCEQIGQLAQSTMRARQDGFRMSDQIKVAESLNHLREIARDQIIKAYAEPQYTTEKAKQDAIRRFVNTQEQWCFSIAPAQK